MATTEPKAAEFKVRDLMISVRPGAGGGAVGLFEDTPPAEATPITPVAAVAAYTPRLRVVDALVAEVAVKDRPIAADLERVALDVGRIVVGAHIASRLGNAALCMEDMPTCDANPQISPWASESLGVLRSADLALLKEQVQGY